MLMKSYWNKYFTSSELQYFVLRRDRTDSTEHSNKMQNV